MKKTFIFEKMWKTKILNRYKQITNNARKRKETFNVHCKQFHNKPLVSAAELKH